MATFKVSNDYTTKSFDNLDEVLAYIVCNVSNKTIIDLLDDIHEPLHIGSLTYSAGTTLYKIDRLAFNKIKNEYISSFISDMAYEIKQGEKEMYYLDFTIQVIKD